MLIAAILFTVVVNAYGFYGHRLSAALTWDLLSGHAKDRLGFKPNDRQQFIRLACRPDRIKHRPGMEWAQPLHFLNTQDHPPYYCQGRAGLERIAEATPDNLLQAARNFTVRLADLLRAKKRLSWSDQVHVLSFAVHFVADLHQPLHICSREKGGLRRKVRFLGKERSLHALWDTHLLKHLVDTYRMDVIYAAVKGRAGRMRVQHADRDIGRWAAHTSSFNCRYVWRHLKSNDNVSQGHPGGDRLGDDELSKGHLGDDDLSKGYLRSVRYAVLELMALSALRTTRLLEDLCA